jgi:hypothetical protein
MRKTIQFSESAHGSYDAFCRTHNVMSVTPTEWRTQAAVHDPGSIHSPAGLYSSPEKTVISKALVEIEDYSLPQRRADRFWIGPGGSIIPDLPPFELKDL